MKKLTRRELLAAAALTAAAAEAQTPSTQSPSTGQDWAKVSREANQRNAEALAKIDIPVAIEPAFVFKA